MLGSFVRSKSRSPVIVSMHKMLGINQKSCVLCNIDVVGCLVGFQVFRFDMAVTLRSFSSTTYLRLEGLCGSLVFCQVCLVLRPLSYNFSVLPLSTFGFSLSGCLRFL